MSTQARRAVALNRFFNNPVWVIVRYLSYCVAVASILILVLAFLFTAFTSLKGLSLFALTPMLLLFPYELYLRYLQHHPNYQLSKSDLKLAENRYDFDSALLIHGWKKSTWQWQVFWQNAQKIKGVNVALLRLGLHTQILLEAAPGKLSEASANNLINSVSFDKTANVFDLLRSVFQLPEMQTLKVKLRLDENAINDVFAYYQYITWAAQENKQLWLRGKQHRSGGFAREWAVSYTNLLDRYTQIVPDSIAHRALAYPLWSRQVVLDEIKQSLSKSSTQNILLVGPVGSGRTEVFFHLANEVIYSQTKSRVDGFQVRILEVDQLLAITEQTELLQSVVNGIFADLRKAGNVILYIPELDRLISKSKEIGRLNISSLFAEYLSSSSVHVVASVDELEYTTLVKTEEKLAEQMSVVQLMPPTESDLIKILLSEINTYENSNNVFFTYSSLLHLVEVAKQYLKNEASPQREIKLAEEVAIAARGDGAQLVTTEQVNLVVERITNVDIADTSEQTNALTIFDQLKEMIIGQDEALKQISNALIRSRAGLSSTKRPAGTFLFLGPTGVGKTETAKSLSVVTYGSTSSLIRLDMAEYTDSNALQKLLGTDAKTDPGSLTVAIQQQPSSVVLLDEFEKSSSAIKNAFLSVLDEGHLTTNYGRVLDFTNSIIIATSNAGSNYIQQQISAGLGYENVKTQLVDQLLKENIFSPELINRFDGVVIFSPLSPESVKQIVNLQIGNLSKQLYTTKGLELKLSSGAVETLAKRGYDPVFGARALNRVIKNDLETAIAKQIIEKNPPRGTELVIEQL